MFVINIITNTIKNHNILILYDVIWYNMVKLLLELSDTENGIVEVFKSVNKLKTKQEAIKSMITYFEVSIKPKNITRQEYFK